MRPKSVTTSHLVLLACLASFSLFGFRLSNAGDTLTAGEVMKDWAYLESQNKMFRLLFFYPAYSSKRYLGIQFMVDYDTKMVWVANRENPLNDTSGYLSITKDGYLVITDERETSITVNLGTPAVNSNTTATLLDSGNLVLKAGHQVVWQSFDHPTDTILPGMKFGLFDLKLTKPRNVFFTSWVGLGVPAAGAFTLGVDPNSTEQLRIWKRGVPYWRSGGWNGRNHSQFPFGRYGLDYLNFSYTSNENESYFTYSPTKDNFSWVEMNSTGNLRIFLGDIGSWSLLGGAVSCDAAEEYSSDDGCIEQKPSKCSSGEEFVFELGRMESWEGSMNSSMGLSDCEEACRNNCSCTAYGSYSPDGSGCMFSYGQREFNPPIEWEETFYIRNTTAKNDTRAAPRRPINNITAPVAPPLTLPDDIGKALRMGKLKVS